VYNAFKTQISDLLGISKDALHIHLGLAIYLIVVVVFRRPLASWVPWLALLGFEIVNEFTDIFHEGVMRFQVGDSLKDVLNTMFWPTVVLLAARWHRSRRRAAAGPAA